jgi:hypothetical protein
MITVRLPGVYGVTVYGRYKKYRDGWRLAYWMVNIDGEDGTWWRTSYNRKREMGALIMTPTEDWLNKRAVRGTLCGASCS